MSGGVRRAALLTTGLTLAGAALGLVRDLAIAFVFGAGPAVDAFLVAQGLMNLVLGLIAGALAKSAIPVVARAADRGEPGTGLGTVRAALGLALVVLTLGAAAVWLGADTAVAVLAPGFDEPTAALTVRLTRIVLVATVLIAATNLLAGAAQALGRFGAAAGQGIAFNVVMITAAVLAGPVLGIEALAWGFVIGSAARLLLQLPSWRGHGVPPTPTARWRDPGLAELLRLVPALLVGSSVSTVNTLVDRAVASTVSAGAVAAVNFAARLVSTVDMLLISTLLAVLYPRFAAAVAPARRAELRGLVDRGALALLTVLTPVTVVLVLTAEPLVRLVFGHGQFDARAVAVTASAAGVLAVGLPALAVRELAARTAYGLGDGRIVVLTALAAMVVNVAGDLLLAPRFGVAGIAAATVASGIVVAATTWIWLSRKHSAVPPLWRTAWPLALSAAVGTAAGWLTTRLTLPDLATVALTGAAVLTAYTLSLRLVSGKWCWDPTFYSRGA